MGEDMKSDSQFAAQHAFPWPTEKPKVPTDDQGWFNKGHESFLSSFTGPHVSCVIELGSWLGKSTRWLAQSCPNAMVYAVDTWNGSCGMNANPENAAKLPTLYDTFLANCWRLRQQIVPVRTRTLDGMARLHELGVTADLVYVDAAHDEKNVYEDVSAIRNHWPHAQITGDDWNLDSVQLGVRRAARARDGLPALTPILSPGTRCWALAREA